MTRPLCQGAAERVRRGSVLRRAAASRVASVQQAWRECFPKWPVLVSPCCSAMASRGWRAGLRRFDGVRRCTAPMAMAPRGAPRLAEAHDRASALLSARLLACGLLLGLDNTHVRRAEYAWVAGAAPGDRKSVV